MPMNAVYDVDESRYRYRLGTLQFKADQGAERLIRCSKLGRFRNIVRAESTAQKLPLSWMMKGPRFIDLMSGY